MKIWTTYFLLILTIIAECRVPDLTNSDAKAKIEEILQAHVCYKALSPKLVKRVLQNFLEELDPTKTYFLKNEIDDWETPSDFIVDKTLEGFKSADFSTFHEIHTSFLQAIERRNGIELELVDIPLPMDVKSEEFKETIWESSREDLKNKILRIKALQMLTAEKINNEHSHYFIQRLQKRRICRESELTGQTDDDRTKIVLTYLLKSVATALDSHTNYFTPNEANQFMIQVQQRLFGIGAQLRDDLDGLTITRILEHSPASQSMKLKINDKIVAVNEEPVIGLNIEDAVELIRGEQGTPVLLTLIRDGKTLDIELIRGEILLEESRLETHLEPYGDGQIATLRLFSFYQDAKHSSALDMKKALMDLQLAHPLKGVVIDLRSNAGGLLTQAISVTGLFISKGIVVSIKDSTGKIQHLREVERNAVWDGPLIVLINRASASAAEIVAQTLQDYGRAIVVGDEHSFGKGSFQTFTLNPTNQTKVNPQGEYKVTRGKYYTVSGKSPQLNGVLSDIVIPGILSQIDIGERFSKFPLEIDTIDPHFKDDLSDLSAFQRLQLGSSYRLNLQPRLETYAPYLNLIKENSRARIENNKNYQEFLNDLQKKNFDSPQVDFFNQGDLQYIETLNVMKDLIFLLSTIKTFDSKDQIAVNLSPFF